MFGVLKSVEIRVSPTIKLVLSLSEFGDDRYDSDPEFRRVIVISDVYLLRDDDTPQNELKNIQAHAIVGAIALVSEFSGHEQHELYGELRVGGVIVKLWNGEFKKQ